MAELRPAALLGVAPGVPGGVDYLDADGSELLLAGARALVAHDVDGGAQRLLVASPSAVRITTVALSANKKLLAFAEYGADGTPTVHVHDAATRKRKRTLAGLTPGRGTPVTHLSFVGGSGKALASASPPLLLVQCGAPDWNLHLVLWDKAPGGRVVAVQHGVAAAAAATALSASAGAGSSASLSASLLRSAAAAAAASAGGNGASFSSVAAALPPPPAVCAVDADPGDATVVVAACGPGCLRLYRLVDGALRHTTIGGLRRDPGPDVTAHTWLPGSSLVVGHATGELWLVAGGEYRGLVDRAVRPRSVPLALHPATASLTPSDAAAAGADAAADGTATQSATLAPRQLPAVPSSRSLIRTGTGISTVGSGGAGTGVGRPVYSLAAFSGGFLAGCDGGVVQVLERSAPLSADTGTAAATHSGGVAGGVSAAYACVAEFDALAADRGTSATAPAGETPQAPPLSFSSNGGAHASLQQQRRLADRVVRLVVSPNEEECAVVTAGGAVLGFRLGGYESALRSASPEPLFRRLLPATHELLAPAAEEAGGDHAADVTFTPAAAAVGVAGQQQPSLPRSAPQRASLRRGSLGGGPATWAASAALCRLPTAAEEAVAAVNRGLSGRCYEPLFLQPSGGLPAITALAACARKPWFATGGADRSVRLWTAAASAAAGAAASGVTVGRPAGGALPEGAPQLVCALTFDAPPTALALHPTGHHAVVGFDGRALLANVVLTGGLRGVKELPARGPVADAAFSHGGQYFAVASGPTVSVYGTYTTALVATLRGHADRVTALAWSRDDRCLLTAGRDGAVMRWAIVVPNATSGGAPFDGAAGTAEVWAASTESATTRGSFTALPPSMPPLAGDGSAGAPVSSSSPSSLVGRALHTLTVPDLVPTAVVCGSSESGKDVYVAGVVTRGGLSTPLLRQVSLAAGPRDPPLADVPLPGGQCVRSLLHLPAQRLLAVGLGHSVEPCRQGPPLQQQPSVAGSGGSGSAPNKSAALRGAAWAAANDDAVTVASGWSRVGTPTGSGGSGLLRSTSRGGVSLGPGDGGDTLPPQGARSYRPLGAYTRADTGATGGSSGGHTTMTAAGSSSSAPPAHTDAAGTVRLMSTAPAALAAAADHRSPLPLPPPSTYAHLHGGPLVRLAAAYGGRLLVSVAADGSIGLSHVQPAAVVSTAAADGAAATGGGGGLPFAEETLVAHAELEAVDAEAAALAGTLGERTARLAAALAAMDAAHEAAVRDATAAHASALVEARAALEETAAGKAAAVARGGAALAAAGERHAAEAAGLEALYATRLAGEAERLNATARAAGNDDAAAAAGLARLGAAHAAEVAALRARYAAAVAGEDAAAADLDAQARSYKADAEEAADALEAAADADLDATRRRSDARLAAEAKASLLLRGENGFMKRRFLGITKDISAQKDELAALAARARELGDTVSSLRKDVAGHQREISERGDTLGDKEARIYDLKKKNQELEKFKFVLNYKIQELRRQIAPRKREMADLRDAMKEMELELLQYHRSNGALDLMIADLTLRRDGMRHEVAAVRRDARAALAAQTQVARDVAAVRALVGDGGGGGGSVPQAQAHAQLRAATVRLYSKYVHGEAGSSLTQAALPTPAAAAAPATAGAATANSQPAPALQLPVGVDVGEVQREMARQRGHLERCVDGVSAAVAKDVAAAGGDEARLARDHAALAAERDALTRELVLVQAEVDRLRRQEEEEDEEAAATTERLGDGGDAAATAPSTTTQRHQRRERSVAASVRTAATGSGNAATTAGDVAEAAFFF